ncbi:hypothetical protein AMTR_s00092p00064520 [Amborella trichopoda]|uniref:Uncharacterized protein n=1 Tax=Amborella trichopoda TaxID=13333 RepID=W1NUC3_AMBTC|nr:hypothetical protein AMTR_s00092p00064520 [Amborella trichopoda]
MSDFHVSQSGPSVECHVAENGGLPTVYVLVREEHPGTPGRRPRLITSCHVECFHWSVGLCVIRNKAGTSLQRKAHMLEVTLTWESKVQLSVLVSSPKNVKN